MAHIESKRVNIDDSLEILVNFAVERSEIKQLLTGLPEKDEINPVTVEYELQLLQILAVGWSISYFLEDAPEKQVVIEKFWYMINELSKKISEALAPSLGSEFDYFSILKQRLDLYVKAIDDCSDISDPGVVIGPLFAGLCGDDSDDYMVLAGKAAFHISLRNVKRDLESVIICIK